MDLEAAGKVLQEREEVISAARLDGVARAIGGKWAEDTASLVPFFGPTVGGEATAVQGLGLDMSKALLGGLSYEWVRPFVRGETVTATVYVERVFDKGTNRLGVVVSEFRDTSGALVQRQSATFVERSSDASH